MNLSFKKTKLLFAILTGVVTLTSIPQEAVAATNQKKIDACVDEWVKARRKEIGPDEPIRMDQLDEWEGWCKAGKSPKASKAEPQTATTPATSGTVSNNASKISSLGFPTEFLKAKIYLQTDLINPPEGIMTFERFISLLVANPRISKVTHIKSGNSQGVLIKVQGAPSAGFLFRYDNGDLFPSHVVNGDEVSRINTTREMYAVSMAIMQIAAAGIQSNK